MGYSDLLDHEVTVYRKGSSVGALQSVDRSYSVVATGQPMAVQTAPERYERRPGGEMTTGQYLGFGEADLDVLEGDILAVTGGADGWSNFGYLRVQGVSKPRGHHTECRLSETTEDPTQ